MEKYPRFEITPFLETRLVSFKQMPPADDGHLEIAMCCINPECNDGRPDKEYKMWVNENSGVYVCYRCDEKGGVVKFLMKIMNCKFETAIRLLRGSLNKSSMDLISKPLLHSRELDIEYEKVEETKTVDLPFGYEMVNGPHPYLEKRGVPWQIAKELEWGISTQGYTKNRLIVPIYQNDELVFWQARDVLEEAHESWGDKKAYRKVLNPKGVSARKVLYNYDRAKGNKRVVLVEGFMDCVKVGNDAMATNGKKLHPAQIELLIDAGVEEVVLMWDRDAYTDGRKKDGKWLKPPSAIKAGHQLRDVFKVRHAILPDKQDPGSYELESPVLRDIIEKAKEI